MSDGSACEQRVLVEGTGGHDSLAQTRRGEKSYVTPSEGKVSDLMKTSCREEKFRPQNRDC